MEIYEPEGDKRLNPNDNYEMYAQATLRVSAEWYATHKAQKATDWIEKERLENEARLKAQAERADEVRDSTMTGIMAGLLPRLGKAGLETFFESDEHIVGLSASDGERAPLVMTYHKAGKTLQTFVDVDVIDEDVTYLSGNKTPREQLKGYDAVLTWLDKLLSE